MNTKMSSEPIIKVNGYVIGEKVGRGTYGEVFKAWTKTKPRRTVAIKSIKKCKLSKEAIDNLVTEISLLKKLKHQFIVSMLDFTWDEVNIYIIMEFCTGGDLSFIIKQRRCLPEHQCRRFLQQLASALRYLHQHNVAHMDLKPGNLLVHGNSPPILKLADFGFARHVEQGETESGLKGSPLYMAPEIFLSKNYDAKVDLWSIGVILYEALFGKAPFSSASLDELIVKIKEDKPIVIPSFRNLSENCRDILIRCLKRDPKNRISFDEFFNHPFLDLEHLPDEDSYDSAVSLVKEAVVADKEKKYEEALDLYNQALQYFVPLLHYETDAMKRARLKKSVDEYVRRAEEVKKLVHGEESHSSVASALKKQISGELDSERCLLVELCRVTPALATGVEICMSGDTYHREGKISHALDRWTAGLGVLVPLLHTEPKGRRRDLLHTSVTQWMEKAEVVKETMEVQEVVLGENVRKKGSNSHGEEQMQGKMSDSLDGRQCCVQ